MSRLKDDENYVVVRCPQCGKLHLTVVKGAWFKCDKCGNKRRLFTDSGNLSNFYRYYVKYYGKSKKQAKKVWEIWNSDRPKYTLIRTKGYGEHLVIVHRWNSD